MATGDSNDSITLPICQFGLCKFRTQPSFFQGDTTTDEDCTFKVPVAIERDENRCECRALGKGHDRIEWTVGLDVLSQINESGLHFLVVVSFEEVGVILLIGREYVFDF